MRGVFCPDFPVALAHGEFRGNIHRGYSHNKKGRSPFFISSDLVAEPETGHGTYCYYPREEADKSFYQLMKQAEIQDFT